MGTALKETLLDFQWDRPDITSPAKLALRAVRSRRSCKTISSEEDLSTKSKNVLFLVSECPHSKEDFEGFVPNTGVERESLGEVSELILPRSLRDLMAQNQVVLHWVDSSLYSQVMSYTDHVGYEALSSALLQQGGSMLPLAALLWLCNPEVGKLWKQQPGLDACGAAHLHAWPEEGFPFDSSMGYLLSSQQHYRMAFPIQEGVLRWGEVTCNVSVEPVSPGLHKLCCPVSITLSGVLQEWKSSFSMDSILACWLLQQRPQSILENAEDGMAFHHLLRELSAQAFPMFAEVSDGDMTHTAVFAPLSTSTALLFVVRLQDTYLEEVLSTNPISMATAMPSTDLPDVVSSVLNVVYDIMEDDDKEESPNGQSVCLIEYLFLQARVTVLFQNGYTTSSEPVQGHFQQCCLKPGSLGLTSQGLFAEPEEGEPDHSDESQLDLTEALSELYQGIPAEASIDKRGTKRGAQRTPVRQKMKTMSRSLQMLNTARLNVKAQKSQLDDSSGAERGPDRMRKRRSGNTSKHHHTAPSQYKLVADMLRIISLTKDPIYLSKFLEDILPVYQNVIPKILADVYHSLGIQLPEALALVLPSDFFSDESLVRESTSPVASQDPVSDAGQQLEELRDRSAKKRKSGKLTRHLSTSDATQSLRQIEIPRKSLRVQAKSQPSSAPEEPFKQPVQEVTKVRRNLFKQQVTSPRKTFSRSRSVSAVEGSKHKHLHAKDGTARHTLLTKKVAETPIHKQVSNRLLQRQRAGRLKEKPKDKELVLHQTTFILLQFPGPFQEYGESPHVLTVFCQWQPDRTPSRTPCKRQRSSSGIKTPKKSPHTPLKMSPEVGFAIGRDGIVLRGSPFRSTAQRAPHKNSHAETNPESSQLDTYSSQATTEDNSIDISEATVIKTELSDGLKMKISFSRKPARPSEVSLVETSAESSLPMPRRSYGFRRTPDRQQRAAAARLESSKALPHFSTSNILCEPVMHPFQLEPEMQGIGMPKRKLRRIDSFCTGEPVGENDPQGLSQGLVNVKNPKVESPLSRCPKARGHTSPSVCTRGTPAKSTPGKGGVQTFICQSYTPTTQAVGTPSPSMTDPTPWTPSPQSRGRSTPESLNKWPRRKRAGLRLPGGKDASMQGVQPLVEEGDDAELEGVCQLPDVDECRDVNVWPGPGVLCSPFRGQCSWVPQTPTPTEDVDFAEQCVHQSKNAAVPPCDKAQSLSKEDLPAIAVTTPSTKAMRSVSASGILALTESPLFYTLKSRSSRGLTAGRGFYEAKSDKSFNQ
ncbi:Treslin-like [Scleropages formosus]|uniref:Treslin-like n=1 Tax=Scleropages formosus TaxID=113540 RepID=A0A0P7UIQ6_SCLFO|nr:Treslin-like [Scleropages formosus]